MNPAVPSFVVATPFRSVCDINARALAEEGLLRRYCLGTRRGTAGIPAELTRLLPVIGALATGSAMLFGSSQAESFRFRLHPMFDHWVKSQLRPGDNMISSYGYANASFARVRKCGGKTFLDGGNSHPENFWAILEEEHRRWNFPYPPLPTHHYERSLRMLEHVDFVLSPSTFVTESFLARGFRSGQIIPNVYPVDLSCFAPADVPRPTDRPLTIICTGSLSLRKGTPYLFEAFRMIRREVPDARLLLTKALARGMDAVLPRYQDLPVEWAPPLPHPELASRLRTADVFVLPSLEDGFAQTVAEAMACGLPVVTTPNTGASDLVEDGINGSIVPIRDPSALAEAVLAWWERIRAGETLLRRDPETELGYQHFKHQFLGRIWEVCGVSLEPN